MDRNMPLPGTFYRNFEGNICQIMCIARNCVDKEKEVVYQKMFPPFDIWAEPLESFMQETDNTSRCGQKYKFEQIEVNTVDRVPERKETINRETKNKELHKDIAVKREEIPDSVLKDALLKGSLDRKVAGKIPDSEIAQRGFMEFLDANNYHDKYIIFSALRNYLDTHLLNNIAVSLDIVLEDGDVEEQYESIRRCLQTFERYETKRLR